MRILQFAPLFQPVGPDMEYGCAERVVLMLDRTLTAAGHEVVTIALDGSRVAGRLVAPSGHERSRRERRCPGRLGRSVGFMFVMRPACVGDQEAIAVMIRARSTWMRGRGIVGWDSWESSAEVLAAQAGDSSFPVWVMTAANGVVAGCTSLYEQSPPWFWTEAEQAEPCFFLATTVTDPAFSGQRAGALMAWSVLDLAARTGKQWVRRSTTEAGLVRYYRDVQGWQVIRVMERQGFTVTGMARRAERRDGLPVRLAVAAGLAPGFSGE